MDVIERMKEMKRMKEWLSYDEENGEFWYRCSLESLLTAQKNKRGIGITHAAGAVPLGLVSASVSSSSSSLFVKWQEQSPDENSDAIRGNLLSYIHT